MVDVSAVPDVKLGDEVVVLGKQGDQEISADDLAAINGTINYEITCASTSEYQRSTSTTRKACANKEGKWILLHNLMVIC